MLGCTAKSYLLAVCSMQLVVVMECQVFDFLGFMYGPILANFFHIIFVILGVFGASQFHSKYIIAYTGWNVLWLGWCALVMSFYLEAGSLDREGDLLSLGTGSRSWWEINGPGCVPDFTAPLNSTSGADPDPSRPPRPTRVDGCWLPYYHIETLQAVVQLILCVLGIVGGSVVSKSYYEEDDGCKYCNLPSPVDFKFPCKFSCLITNPTKWLQFTLWGDFTHKCRAPSKANGSRPSLFGTDLTTPSLTSTALAQVNGYGVQPASPRPMTPRRVKRRSVQARDAGITTLSRASQRRSARSRASQRRRPHQSPVSRLLDQQNRFLDSSLDENRPRGSGYTNPVFQQSSNSSINQSGLEEVYRPQSARSSYSNYHASRPISYLHNNEVFSNQAVAQVPINTNRASARRVRADLPRGGPSSFLAQGPPAYREGKDSETVI